MREQSVTNPVCIPGQICGCFDKEQFHIGIIVSLSEKGCLVNLDDSESIMLNPFRIILATEGIYDLDNQETALSDFAANMASCKDKLSVSDIWQQMKHSAQSYTLPEIIKINNLPETDACLFALYLSLREEAVYFRQKKGIYYPRNEKEYNEFLLEVQQNELDDAFYYEISEWLQKVVLTEKTSDKSVSASALKADSLARLEEEIAHFHHGKLPSRLNHIIHNLCPDTNSRDCILLIRKVLGQIDNNTNPMLAVSGLPCLFTPAVKKAAAQINDYLPDNERRDLRYLHCWTIDAAETQDIDDAISLQQTEDGWELGIHISDVSCFIERNSILDKEAYKRSSSIYLPENDIHMLPEDISCSKASLRRDKDRPALSLLCTINRKHEIVSSELFLSIIRVTKRFTYDELEHYLNMISLPPDANNSDTGNSENEVLHNLLVLQSIERKFLQKRIHNGALIFPGNGQSPARSTVAECMVIYNSILAEYTKQHNLPVFFRYLEELIPDRDDSDTEENFLTPPSVLGIAPLAHKAMGLTVYAQFTSPLRRYSDLINQRQVVSYLTDKTFPHDKTELREMIPHLMQTRQAIRRVTYQADQFTRLTNFALESMDKEIEAIVVKHRNKGLSLQIPAYNCRIQTEWKGFYVTGTILRIIVSDVNPETGKAVVRLV